MKKQILISLVLLVTSLGLAATAQTSEQQLRANVPFAFNVGRVSLPAGEYTITVVNPSSDRKVLRIRSNDGRLSAMTQTTTVTGKAHDNAKLIFNRYGDRYVFAVAELAGDTTSLAAVKSGFERTLQRTIGNTGTVKDVIAINAR
jgi:hypothetical protein